MARKHKQTSLVDVSGMSIKDIMDVDIETFNNYNERELRQVTSRLVSASNKRIRNLEKRGITSPAYKSLGTKTRFSVKLDKNVTSSQRINKLRQEFASARNFLTKKTSTIRGYESYQKSIVDELEKSTGIKIKSGDVTKIYETLNKAQERGIVPTNTTGVKGGSKGSLQAREIITNIINDKNITDENLFDKIESEYNRWLKNPDEYVYDDETEETKIV